MGASVSLQGRFSHDMDKDFSIFFSFQGYTKIDKSLGFNGMVFYIVLAYLFWFQFNIHLVIALSSDSILANSATFSRLII